MKISTLLVVLFFAAQQTTGQGIKKIEELLRAKNFFSFKNYIDSAPKRNLTVRWDILRDVVGNYQEAIVKIEEDKPADSTGSDINNYTIRLLATESKIFYYCFNGYKSKRITNDQWQTYEDTLDIFKDNVEFFRFTTTFKQVYSDTLKEDDLFLTSIVYGEACGLVGTNPEYMDVLTRLIQNNNIDAIRSWLKSANVEKQLYAMKGYRYLVYHGYNLTEEEIRIMDAIKLKKGTAATCSGCLIMDQSIPEIITEIESLPNEYSSLNKVTPASKTSVISTLLAIVIISIAGLGLYFYKRKNTISNKEL